MDVLYAVFYCPHCDETCATYNDLRDHQASCHGR